MKLERLVLVNWGQLRPGDFEMGNMTLLTGESGAGKSTMLDALQSIMTATHRGILSFNPGQDEVSQGQRGGKTIRTLESYVVGAQKNKFSRPGGAQGFMAGVFRPSKGEEHLKPFTALVAAAARVDGQGEHRQAKLESLSLVIVDGAALTYEDFLKDPETNEFYSVERIARHLQAQHPNAKVQDFHDKKVDYLCALYGRFRGKSGVTKDEATNAAKAWVGSIAYRPIGGVHELVRDEILWHDPKQLEDEIERIVSLMREVSNLRKESARLQDNVKRLAVLKGAVDETNGAHEAAVLKGLLVAKAQLLTDDKAIAAKKAAKELAFTKAEEQLEVAKGLTDRGRRWDERRVALAAQLQGIPVHGRKVELEKALDGALRLARETVEELMRALHAADSLYKAANQLLATSVPETCKALLASLRPMAEHFKVAKFERLTACREQLLAVTSAAEPEPAALEVLSQAFNGLNEGFGRLVVSMVGEEHSVLAAAGSDSFFMAQQKTKADDRVRDLSSNKALLARGQVAYPHEIRYSLEVLRDTYPAANPQVLCDLVEPKSDEWQPAIEAFLGGNRFNLIVDPDWERQCIDLFRAKNLAGKIIQGKMVLRDAALHRPPPNSVVHELQSSNPIAWAYLTGNYGSVVKVDDTETLRTTKRGLTIDGIASSGNTMTTCKRVELVFGQRARQLALERVTNELVFAEQQAAQVGQAKTDLDGIRNLLLRLKTPEFKASPLAEAASEIERTQSGLASLDMTEVASLEDALKDLVDRLTTNNLAIQDANRKEGEYQQDLKAAETDIKRFEATQHGHKGELQTELARVTQLVQSNPGLNLTVLLEDVDKELAYSPTLEELRRERESLNGKLPALLFHTREALAEYNGKAKTDERLTVAVMQHADVDNFAPIYADLVVLAVATSKSADALRGVGLYNNRQQLDEAQSSFRDVFTKQFCVEVKTRVDDGVRTLKQMNAELTNLKFGADSFLIDWSVWEPEFQDYLGFFEAVTLLADNTEALDLFGATSLSEKHMDIRDRLLGLLLDDDQERAKRELFRIADYRNYRRYDIFNDSSSGRVRLSKWGTGSGGELETPAYIVRAAIVTNRLKTFEKGPSLRMLANDESFSKMDEKRARAVLSFLRDKLDLQVLSAMPTMKAGGLKDEFNREYSFSTLTPVANGELDFVADCEERVFTTDKMRELWARQRVIARERAKQLFDAANPEEPTTEFEPEAETVVASALNPGAPEVPVEEAP